MILDRDLEADLALALELADIADDITLPFYDERSFNLTWKTNRTEVTEADRLTESAISAAVAARRPDDGLLGEEHGVVGNVESLWRWVIDPIDGTSNFVRGIPVWATLIALTHAQHGAVVGVVSAPSLDRRWWAARGLGAFADGRPCRVSTVARLDEAQVCVTFSKEWHQSGLTDKLVALLQGAYRARGFGDFWQHMLVAEGAIDLAIDAIGLAPYDLAAVMVVVEEAGGTFTDRHGARTYLNDSAVSSNGLLHHHIDSLRA
ncbi:MAG: inositol monophosphatase family protein [Ilumatobacteraceae bacterium]